MEEELILCFNVKISLPAFEKLLSKKMVKIFSGPSKEQQMKDYIKKFAEENKIDKSIVTLDYVTITIDEYQKLKKFVSEFNFKNLREEEVIFILFKFKNPEV